MRAAGAVALGLAAAAVAPGPVRAEGPPPEYFTGVYERVGRDDAAPPGLLNDRVRIDPVEGGLAVSACKTGGEPLFVLEFQAFGDVTNLLVSRPGRPGPDLWCLYGNNGDNYPLLTCASGDGTGTRFTLWPAPDAPCGG